MPSILFVCTANRFRSPLAAAFLRKSLQEKGISEFWEISSAGTWATPGLPVIPGIHEPARRFGIDLSGHQSRRVTSLLLSKNDLIVVMQACHREALLTEDPGLQDRVYLLSEAAEHRSYDIPDALGSKQETLELIVELDALIRQGSQSLCDLATHLQDARHMSEN